MWIQRSDRMTRHLPMAMVVLFGVAATPIHSYAQG